jgi:hypothetical protein
VRRPSAGVGGETKPRIQVPARIPEALVFAASSRPYRATRGTAGSETVTVDVLLSNASLILCCRSVSLRCFVTPCGPVSSADSDCSAVKTSSKESEVRNRDSGLGKVSGFSQSGFRTVSTI